MTKWYMGADGVEYPNTEAGVDSGVDSEQAPQDQQDQQDQREQWQVEQDQEAVTLMDLYYSDLFSLLSKAHARRRSWKASGEEGMDPLKAFELSLGRIQNDARDLMSHKHTWNESGFCETCGEDGNA